MECYYVVICDLYDKYESDLKDIGEINRHFDNRMDIIIKLGIPKITIRRDDFDIIIDIGTKLICIPPCDYGNIYIY